MQTGSELKRIPMRLFLMFVALLIAVLSHQPSLKPPFQLFPFQDKLFHMIEFGGLSLALVLNSDVFSRWKKPALAMLLSGAVWAVFDEIHQSVVPGRDCSAGDVFADLAGLLVGILLFSSIFAGRKTSKEALSSRGK